MEDSNIEFFDFTEEMKISAESELAKDQSHLSPFIYNKFDKLSSKMWNTFYKNNSTNFYKDRHYISKEFPELSGISTLLEVGCGVGNAFFPILEDFPMLRVQACDFSGEAIRLVKENPLYREPQIIAKVCDISEEAVGFNEPCDAVLMLFVLSAIAPEKQRAAIVNATSSLRSGGMVFFRDYARYDLAQLRLAKKGNKRLKDNFYLKQDGTRVYYFTTDDVSWLFQGFNVVQNCNHYRLIKNRKDDKEMHRVWLQAKLIKN